MFLFFSALSALDLVSLCVELVGITLAMNFSSSIKYWSERSKTHKLPLLLCPLPLPGKESHSSPICFQWMLNRSMEEKSTPTTSCCCCFCSSIMFSPITAEIPSFSLKWKLWFHCFVLNCALPSRAVEAKGDDKFQMAENELEIKEGNSSFCSLRQDLKAIPGTRCSSVSFQQ